MLKTPDMQMKILFLLSLLFIFSLETFAKAKLYFVGAKTQNTNILHYYGVTPEMPDYAIIHVVFENEGVVISAEPYAGVSQSSFETFLQKYLTKNTKIWIGQPVDQTLADKAFEASKKYIGLPYNKNYNGGLREDSKYCSQLIYDSYKFAANFDYFKLAPITGTNGVLGISPQSILVSDKVIRKFYTNRNVFTK